MGHEAVPQGSAERGAEEAQQCPPFSLQHSFPWPRGRAENGGGEAAARRRPPGSRSELGAGAEDGSGSARLAARTRTAWGSACSQPPGTAPGHGCFHHQTEPFLRSYAAFQASPRSLAPQPGPSTAATRTQRVQLRLSHRVTWCLQKPGRVSSRGQQFGTPERGSPSR